MTHISHIEYATRAALVAALTDIRTTPGVEQVDIIGLGRTLRVVSSGDDPVVSDHVEEPVVEEDLIGVEKAAPPAKKKRG